MNHLYKKLLLSLVILMLMLLAMTGWLDQQGKDYTEQGLKRVLVTYALSRGLNGVISVAQGTEVAVQPVGVGITFTPGQILDPVNDLIERFSTVVLVSGAALGIQRILIEITAWHWFSLFCVLVLLATVIVIWRGETVAGEYKQLLYRVATIFIVIRFMVPMIAIVNEGIYLVFLQTQYEESKQQLELTGNEIEQMNPQAESSNQADDDSFVSKMKALYDSASSAMDIQAQLESLKQIVSDLSRHALNMMVVFVLQTIVMPVLFLFLTYKLLLRLTRF